MNDQPDDSTPAMTPLPEPSPPAPDPDEATLPESPAPASAGVDTTAAAAPPETGRAPGRAPVLGLVALAVAVAFASGIVVGRATAPAGDAASPPPVAVSPGASVPASPGASPTSVPSPTGIAALPSEGNRLGRADARVVVDYWADYQCPFCATFAEQVIPQLESRIADGTVALVHRDLAFLDARSAGQESLDAAIAVRCAGQQGRYWQMHDAVYAAQAGENQGAFARDRLADIAAGVGLDATDFAACMDSREPLVQVLEDTSAGTRAGIESTPTVVVNGQRFLGVAEATELLAAIDAAAAGASPAPQPTARPLGDPWAGVTTSGSEAGDPAAPVTVELWMDYQAPSGVVVTELGPELRTRIEDGAIRVVRRDLATLGDESVLAAATARCVARQDGPAWLTHDVLANSGRGAGQGVFTVTRILRFGANLGLEIGDLSDCLDDPAVSAAVEAETAVGTGLGLTAAPAVIVRKGDTEVARFTGELDAAKIVAAIDGAR